MKVWFTTRRTISLRSLKRVVSQVTIVVSLTTVASFTPLAVMTNVTDEDGTIVRAPRWMDF